MTLDDLLRKGRNFLLIGLAALVLTSCSIIRFVVNTPASTVAEKPAITLTVEPPVFMSPTPDLSATPSLYPTLDASVLPPVLQDFLSRYDTFEEMNTNVLRDYILIPTEVDGSSAGSLFSSPLISLEKGISDCSETALISVLFGEKWGYYPYELVLTYSDNMGNPGGHAIHVFQNNQTQLWGYNDSLTEYSVPSFSSISELANFYITNHPFNGTEYYNNWSLMDLNKAIDIYGRDWRTTTLMVPITGELSIEFGQYAP